MPHQCGPVFSLFTITRVYDCVTVFTARASRASLFYCLCDFGSARTFLNNSFYATFILWPVGSFHRPLRRSNHVFSFAGFTGGSNAHPRLCVSMGCVRMCVFVCVGSFVNCRYVSCVNILGGPLPAQMYYFSSLIEIVICALCVLFNISV